MAIFAFVDAALIKPLPYRDPKRLVAVFEVTRECPQCNVSYFNFRDWKHAVPFFSSLDAWGFSTYLLRTAAGTEPRQLGVRVASDGLWFLSYARNQPDSRPRFLFGRGYAGHTAHRFDQLFRVAEPFRRQPERGRTGRDFEQCPLHHRRSAAS